MRTSRTFAVIALALWAWPALAQTPMPMPPAPPRSTGPATTIDALVERAVIEGPTIRAAWSRVEAAKGSVTQAAARANPELMTEHRDAFDGMNRQTAVGVAWPLELGRRQWRAYPHRGFQ